MRKTILALVAATSVLVASAQNEKLIIKFTNGETYSCAVSDVDRMYFEDDAPTNDINGTYTGAVEMVIGGQFKYQTTATCVISTKADGTIDLTIREYDIPGTVMGDMTLGAITITGIPFDEAKNAYFIEYGGENVTRHLKAVNGGTVTMDKDYDVKAGSTVTISAQDGTVTLTDSFRIGSMPFPLVATFTAQ